MEEIKVGEYGRTNLGKIFIFAWLVDENNKRYTNKVILGNGKTITNEFYYFEKGEQIVKHSPKLIDLIEEGDYVNGCYVLDTRNKPKTITVENGGRIYEEEILDNNDIESIVTKEQYNSMKYIVGDESNEKKNNSI